MSGDRVDLNFALREAKAGEEDASSDDLYSFLALTVPALVAELRAAREVIAHYDPPHCSKDCSCARSAAWRAYNKAVDP